MLEVKIIAIKEFLNIASRLITFFYNIFLEIQEKKKPYTIDFDQIKIVLLKRISSISPLHLHFIMS